MFITYVNYKHLKSKSVSVRFFLWGGMFSVKGYWSVTLTTTSTLSVIVVRTIHFTNPLHAFTGRLAFCRWNTSRMRRIQACKSLASWVAALACRLVVQGSFVTWSFWIRAACGGQSPNAAYQFPWGAIGCWPCVNDRDDLQWPKLERVAGKPLLLQTLRWIPRFRCVSERGWPGSALCRISCPSSSYAVTSRIYYELDGKLADEMKARLGYRGKLIRSV